MQVLDTPKRREIFSHIDLQVPKECGYFKPSFNRPRTLPPPKNSDEKESRKLDFPAEFCDNKKLSGHQVSSEASHTRKEITAQCVQKEAPALPAKNNACISQSTLIEKQPVAQKTHGSSIPQVLCKGRQTQKVDHQINSNQANCVFLRVGNQPKSEFIALHPLALRNIGYMPVLPNFQQFHANQSHLFVPLNHKLATDKAIVANHISFPKDKQQKSSDQRQQKPCATNNQLDTPNKRKIADGLLEATSKRAKTNPQVHVARQTHNANPTYSIKHNKQITAPHQVNRDFSSVADDLYLRNLNQHEQQKRQRQKSSLIEEAKNKARAKMLAEIKEKKDRLRMQQEAQAEIAKKMQEMCRNKPNNQINTSKNDSSYDLHPNNSLKVNNQSALSRQCVASGSQSQSKSIQPLIECPQGISPNPNKKQERSFSTEECVQKDSKKSLRGEGFLQFIDDYFTPVGVNKKKKETIEMRASTNKQSNQDDLQKASSSMSSKSSARIDAVKLVDLCGKSYDLQTHATGSMHKHRSIGKETCIIDLTNDSYDISDKYESVDLT